MTLLFLSHPVRGDAPGNLRRALRWLAYLTATRTESIIAPWIAGLMAGEDDSDPEQRERGLQTCTETARRCDGIILVGGHISSGMRRELDAVRESGGRVIDLTHMGTEPPTVQTNADILREDFALITGPLARVYLDDRGRIERIEREKQLPRHWLAEHEAKKGQQ